MDVNIITKTTDKNDGPCYVQRENELGLVSQFLENSNTEPAVATVADVVNKLGQKHGWIMNYKRVDGCAYKQELSVKVAGMELLRATGAGNNVKDARHACRKNLLLAYDKISRNIMKRDYRSVEPRADEDLIKFDNVASVGKGIVGAALQTADVPRQEQETAEVALTMSTSEHANVQMVDTTVPSISEVAKASTTKRSFINELPVTLQSLADRWCLIDNFNWTTSTITGGIIRTIDLPVAMLQQSRCAPNTLLFDQYAYFKTDMRLKIQVNSNPGMSGMLVAGVMYNATSSTAAGVRIVNSAQLIQMPHVRINAASSNTTELYVPWIFQLPVASTRDTNISRGSYYYTLFIGVLGSLRTGANGPSNASVTVYGTLENTEFYGQRNYRSVVPRGLVNELGTLANSKLVDVAENLLSKLDLADCDRPQAVKEPLTVYQQQNTSMSLATGTHEVKLLQLLHDNTCPHPKDLVPSDTQFSNTFLKRQWGRVTSFPWSTAALSGATLYNMPVSPMRGSIIGTDFLPTPLCGLGMFYGGYHGDIEVKFTFFISKFHSGRVAIFYVPDLLPANANPSCYYSSVVDIQDQSEFIFTIPYQVPTLYASTKARYREWDQRMDDADFLINGTADYPAYGVLSLSIVNPLRANQTASSEIEVMVEMRGGENFHYVLPVATLQPSQNTIEPTRNVEPRADDNRDLPKQNDERQKLVTFKPKLTPALPTWFNSINERYEIRDVVKRYNSVYCLRSSNIPGLGQLEWVENAHVSVYYAPLVPFIYDNVEGPILRPIWRPIVGMTTFGKTLMVAHERISLRTNTTISFRVPWNSNMSMLANGIDPTLTPASMQAYCNGRVTIAISFNVHDAGTVDHQPQTYFLDFDVTAGTLQARQQIENENYGLVDVVSYMHDAFRFFRGDMFYQLDILPYRIGDGADFATFISRAFGDTANFYVFQGFPRTTTIPFYTQMLGSQGLPALSASNWIRDLTTEGVEPNPGPVFSTLKQGLENVILKVSALLGISADASFFNAQLVRLRRVLMVAAAAGISYPLAFALMSEYIYTDIRAGVVRCATTAASVGEILNPSNTASNIDRAMHVVEVATYVLNVYNSNSIVQACLNVACLLNKFGLASVASSAIVSLFGEDNGVHPRAEVDLTTSWTSLIVGSMFSVIGLKDAKAYNATEFLKVTRSFFKDGIHIKRFLDAHVDLFRDLSKWFMGIIGYDREPEDLSADITSWMMSVNYYCEVYNYDAAIEDTRFARKIFELREQAQNYDKMFVQSGSMPPPGYYQYKNKLNKMVDVLAKGGLAETVRPTPYCIWMYGQPGIGKSRITDEILVHVGGELEIVSNNPVYARTSETQYWNGYRQQPLILFPDFAKNQSSTQYLTELNEFMSLVDVWPFNPSFAELEDKRRIVKAESVMVCSNFAFPNITNVGQVDPKAFYRRRHCLVESYIPTSVAESVRAQCGVNIGVHVEGELLYMASAIPQEWFENNGSFAHLRFKIHASGLSKVPMPTEYDLEGLKVYISNNLRLFKERERAHCLRQQSIYGVLSPEGWEDKVNVLPRVVGVEPRADAILSDDFRLTCILDDINLNSPMHIHNFVYNRNIVPSKVLLCGCRYTCEASFPNSSGVGEVTLTYSHLCSYRHLRIEELTPSQESWQGHVPLGSMYGLISGNTYEWADYVGECPHNAYVLSKAFFQVHKDVVRVAVETDDGVTFVLPHQCVTNMFEYSKNSAFSGPKRPGELPIFSSFKLPGFCHAIGTDRRFALVDKILTISIRGTQHTISDVSQQLHLMNNLLVNDEGRHNTSYDTFMTYFYYQQNQPSAKFSRLYSALKKGLSVLYKLIIHFFIVYGLYKTFSVLYGLAVTSEIAGVAPQAYNAGAGASRNIQNEVVRSPQLVSSEPRNQSTIVYDLIMRNTVVITTDVLTIEGLLLCSHYMLCPLHFIKDKPNFKMFLHGKWFEVEGQSIRYVALCNKNREELDMAIVDIPTLPASRNIMGHFISMKETNTIKSHSTLIYRKEGNNFSHESAIITQESTKHNYLSGCMKGIVAFEGYKWTSNNDSFRCGAILVSNARIIGMFNSDDRSTKLKFAAAVNRESIVDALAALGASQFDMRLHRHCQNKSGRYEAPCGSNMVPLGVLEDPITYSGKTQLVPSPLSNQLPGPFLQPAEQRGEMGKPGYEPVFKAASKQIKPKDLCRRSAEVVSSFFLNFLISILPNLVNVKRPFTFEEALCGLEGDNRYPSMNLNTALGWPFKDFVPKGWKKKNVLNIEPPLVDPRLVDYYVNNNVLRKKGIMPDVAFVDFPKDETLKPGKDTRLINGCPIDLFIDMRRYLGQFFVSMRGERTGIAIGMDVHSPEWAKWMAMVPDPIDEDYSNFGLTIHTQVLRVVKELALRWCQQHLDYSETELNVVNVIFEEITCSTHVFGDLKYQVYCGSPSGAYGTDMINSLAGLYYVMYDHYITFGDFSKWSEDINIIYGDDLRRNKLRSHDSFKTNLASIGKIITEDKTGQAFLKRKVNVQIFEGKNYVLAPLPPHVVIDILHWLKQPYFSPEEAMKQRLEGFLNEVAHFGEQTYNGIITMFRNKNITCNYVSFKEWLETHYMEPIADISQFDKLDCKYSQFDLSYLFFCAVAANKDEFDSLFTSRIPSLPQ